VRRVIPYLLVTFLAAATIVAILFTPKAEQTPRVEPYGIIGVTFPRGAVVLANRSTPEWKLSVYGLKVGIAGNPVGAAFTLIGSDSAGGAHLEWEDKAWGPLVPSSAVNNGMYRAVFTGNPTCFLSENAFVITNRHVSDVRAVDGKTTLDSMSPVVISGVRFVILVVNHRDATSTVVQGLDGHRNTLTSVGFDSPIPAAAAANATGGMSCLGSMP
jgi:hypothetical protein